MGQPITRSVLADAVEVAIGAAEASPTGERARRAKAVLLNHPTIARAITPLPRYRSEVLQGVTGVGAAQLLNAFGLTKSLVIAAGWFGRSWNPDEVATVLTTGVSIALAAWAWYGRETASRPLA